MHDTLAAFLLLTNSLYHPDAHIIPTPLLLLSTASPDLPCTNPLAVDLHHGVWHQRCHDPDCRDFRSPALPLPPDAWAEAQQAAPPPPPPQPQAAGAEAGVAAGGGGRRGGVIEHGATGDHGDGQRWRGCAEGSCHGARAVGVGVVMGEGRMQQLTLVQAAAALAAAVAAAERGERGGGRGGGGGEGDACMPGKGQWCGGSIVEGACKGADIIAGRAGESTGGRGTGLDTGWDEEDDDVVLQALEDWEARQARGAAGDGA